MTTNKKILVIAMLDSVHFARWLGQFKDQKLSFYIFPSRKFRKLNSELISLLESKSIATFEIINILKIKKFLGYLDYMRFEIVSKFILKLSRAKQLQQVITRKKFDYIHAIEIQSAGYLIKDIPKKVFGETPIIVTNWGSDIYYFRKFVKHLTPIRDVLAIANFYSGECARDYSLAREFGFAGIHLPCIPNAGGFLLDPTTIESSSPSKRTQISIKGYGGMFGRADLPIKILELIAHEFPDINFFFYSVTKDILLMIRDLPPTLRNRIRVAMVQDRLSQERIMSEFFKSRIFIGCSESDGISTSFLQSLVAGAYPIQTNTSCASEWVTRGAIGSIISLDSSELFEKVRESLLNDQLVDDAATANMKVAKKYLDYDVVKKEALKFYGL